MYFNCGRAEAEGGRVKEAMKTITIMPSTLKYDCHQQEQSLFL
jgi:hypothetical protein